MNAFKKKSLCLAVVAGLGAVGMAGTASAVNINSNGLGQVLIYPYFTVRAGNATYLSVVNTTGVAKAVKVRFLEGRNSREVLDFNLYLSPRDIWTGAVVANSSGNGRLITNDKSCTAPAIPAAGVDFVNYAYSGALIEGIVNNNAIDGVAGSDTMDRTREGYFEIIEMGVITNAAIAAAVTHTSAGVPANCALVQTTTLTTNTGTNGMGVSALANAVAAPSGGLAGTATLINVAAGTDAGYDPVALASFSNVNIWNPPGAVQPDLRQAQPATSVVFKNGVAITSTWTAATADAVSSVLMHDNVINEFVLDTATLSATDWVVTMPTKRFYVPVQDGISPTPAPASGLPPFTSYYYTYTAAPTWTGGACEPVSLQYWDREEQTPQTPATPLQFSPLPTAPGVTGNSLCWEATVVTFNNGNLLGSANLVNVPIASPTQNGWLRMTFNNAAAPVNGNNKTQAMTSIDVVPNTFVGLPVVGFMVQDFVNGNVGGVLSNYAGNFNHKTTTLINGSSAD